MLEKFWIKCQDFSEKWNNWIIMFFIVASTANHIAAVLGYHVSTAALLIGNSIIAVELTKILYRRRKKYARQHLAQDEEDELTKIREKEVIRDSL